MIEVAEFVDRDVKQRNSHQPEKGA